MILNGAEPCSEKSIKFSSKSRNRFGSHTPRINTSREILGGSSSLSIRFHSKNRSQLAVREPTRLLIPFEVISSAFDQNNCGMTSLYQVRLSSKATCADTPGFFNSTTIIGNPFTKPTRSGRHV